jgi:hypothetical protein
VFSFSAYSQVLDALMLLRSPSRAVWSHGARLTCLIVQDLVVLLMHMTWLITAFMCVPAKYHSSYNILYVFTRLPCAVPTFIVCVRVCCG